MPAFAPLHLYSAANGHSAFLRVSRRNATGGHHSKYCRHCIVPCKRPLLLGCESHSGQQWQWRDLRGLRRDLMEVRERFLAGVPGIRGFSNKALLNSHPSVCKKKCTQRILNLDAFLTSSLDARQFTTIFLFFSFGLHDLVIFCLSWLSWISCDAWLPSWVMTHLLLLREAFFFLCDLMSCPAQVSSQSSLQLCTSLANQNTHSETQRHRQRQLHC